MDIPYEEILAKLDQLLGHAEAWKRHNQAPPVDELGGLELAMKVTRLSARTIYKLVHFRQIPHSKSRGRLHFRRQELVAWIDSGRRLTAAEVAMERMEGQGRKPA